MQRTRGMMENSRRLERKSIVDDEQKKIDRTYPTVSPQVGSLSPSHMKLPIKAQRAETNRVAGMNTEVAIMTGLTKMRRRKICK